MIVNPYYKYKYCVSLSETRKSEKMGDMIDFKKIVFHEALINVLNFYEHKGSLFKTV